MFRISTQNKILWLSIPSVYYAFVPYSEALFFLLSSVTLYGIFGNKKGLIWISLFLLSLTRATGVFLAPAFLAMILLSHERKDFLKNLWSYLVIYLSPMIIGTAIFIWYEYKVSGIWFVFFDIEAKYWNHLFSWPNFPLTNLSGPPVIWLSAIMIFIGLFSFCYLVFAFFRWLMKNTTQNNLLIASCGYLFMAMLETILYNTIGDGRTDVSNLLRYGTMNPFFFIFLYHFTINIKYNWKHYVFIFLLGNISWLAFGAYVHIQYFLYFTTNTIIVFLYMSHSNKKMQWPILILVTINIFFQIYYFQHFFNSIYTE